MLSIFLLPTSRKKKMYSHLKIIVWMSDSSQRVEIKPTSAVNWKFVRPRSQRNLPSKIFSAWMSETVHSKLARVACTDFYSPILLVSAFMTLHGRLKKGRSERADFFAFHPHLTYSHLLHFSSLPQSEIVISLQLIVRSKEREWIEIFFCNLVPCSQLPVSILVFSLLLPVCVHVLASPILQRLLPLGTSILYTRNSISQWANIIQLLSIRVFIPVSIL
jgi:hypothetical protein